ncbi:hypothetical protein Pedsa_2001 [Pseudopedobacter saltans DSM 12145]|uniref:DoxX family protein n=1 Tax=Pseudopedobacter saltans (strain ATCC 51119 / DSM 12145 / JCM 21818 / CCUG 39354 / LMG 10337 / NBRC 100064 / NCIMB 13643) TaxID=762903 RepID=F0S9Z6_PSESL|nr:hypothetical protein [Pseudopedobacter saltans]ADY52554.1 hypothetical protein Pedsa_2001 [Pseudopedobacter saltans DSM 12145]
MANLQSSSYASWKEYEKVLFRFLFIYFILQAVPLDWKYYQQVFSINWLNLGFDDIFNLSKYSPQFFPENQTFANWGIIAVLALIGTVIWSFFDKEKKEYNNLYYWLRVILRYRLAIGVIGYGMIKLFPLQSPYPSLSSLNTNYGDISAWKIFSLSLGIVPNYQSFLGGVEVLTGLLLFNRKTASIGAFLIIVFTGNVFISNLAYEGGEYVYSFYLIVIALFIFQYDAVRLYNLIGLERPTEPNRFKPQFSSKNNSIRIVVKMVFLFFFVFLYGYKTYSSYKKGNYHYPTAIGIAGISGLYNVSEFELNGVKHPYSTTDPIRWKDVVFEKWNTISIRSKRPVKIESSITEEIIMEDTDRNYELSGSGGRHYYRYEVDSTVKKLTLYNKNKRYAGEVLSLYYTRLNDSTLVLQGLNETHDSIKVVLQKINKKYLLKEAEIGRRGKLVL